MPRPKEIAWFERIIIGTIILGIMNTWPLWAKQTTLGGVVLLVWILVVLTSFFLALALLISRRRSNVARWIFVGMVVLALPFDIQDFIMETVSGALAVQAIRVVGDVIGCALLFTPAARRWFNQPAAAKPA